MQDQVYCPITVWKKYFVVNASDAPEGFVFQSFIIVKESF